MKFTTSDKVPNQILPKMRDRAGHVYSPATAASPNLPPPVITGQAEEKVANLDWNYR